MNTCSVILSQFGQKSLISFPHNAVQLVIVRFLYSTLSSSLIAICFVNPPRAQIVNESINYDTDNQADCYKYRSHKEIITQ